jgi:DNA-binding GntR family transcriptional regulator
MTPVEDPRAYIRLANHLRTQILDGRFKPGNPVTSITTLSHETGHSRPTIAKAMRVLESEGLIRRYPGLGYYVVPVQPHEPGVAHVR